VPNSTWQGLSFSWVNLGPFIVQKAGKKQEEQEDIKRDMIIYLARHVSRSRDRRGYKCGSLKPSNRVSIILCHGSKIPLLGSAQLEGCPPVLGMPTSVDSNQP